LILTILLSGNFAYGFSGKRFKDKKTRRKSHYIFLKIPSRCEAGGGGES